MQIYILAFCAVFTDPSFYMSSYREKQACSYVPIVLEAAKQNNLDPFLLAGLITVESNWQKDAVSSAGACGLTQVMPVYTGNITKKYTCDQLKDPKTSIFAGAKILSWWINKYGEGDIPTGLCGYYSGFRCKPVINKAGKSYYKKVLAQKQKIQSIYNIKKVGTSVPESE